MQPKGKRSIPEGKPGRLQGLKGGVIIYDKNFTGSLSKESVKR